jgi:UDP-2,3-diacylglucosamine pyrophosphatase LpxH
MRNKKSISVVSLLLVILILVACTATAVATAAPSSTVENTSGALTLEPNISMSDDAGNPPVNDSVRTISFKFNEPLDATTVSGAVKLYQMDASGNPTEQKCVVKINPDSPNYLDINTETVEKFAEGQEYKVVINNTLKSKTGLTLQQDYIGYFATNYTLDLTGNTTLGTTRSQIVTISDIHLGVSDVFAETQVNRDALVNFLTQIKDYPNVAELVIIGDLLDGWFVPMDYVLPDSQSTFFDSVAANNQTVIDAINAIITAGNIKVTYVAGNHDLLLTEADVERILPGINQISDDVQGLGTYITGANSEITIEHGHRYNIFCAPDNFSNRDITNDASSILPAGYFFTRVATSSEVEAITTSANTVSAITAPDKSAASQFGYYLYYMFWKEALTNLPIAENFTDKVIKTNINGYTENVSINDLLPYQDPATGLIDVTLYKNVQDNWEANEKLNGVAVHIPVEIALAEGSAVGYTDVQAKTQYFDVDASKRIVVFGHTHSACIIPGTNLDNQKTIYVNDGTWIDNAEGYPTMTFVVITPPASGSAVEIVNLYKYSLNNTFTQWAEAQAITN